MSGAPETMLRDAAGYHCWKCGADLAGVPLPLPREAVCPKCRAWLHACRQCRFYDARLSTKCHEERAEEVRDKETANFCDWFKPRPDAHRPPTQAKTQAAKARIDALFSGKTGDPTADPARDKLDALFGDRPKKPS